MLSQEAAAVFHQLNNTATYILRIAFAVYFLAPLGQGDFATAKHRFLLLGVPFLAMYALSQAGDLLGSAYEWVGRQILHKRFVQVFAHDVLGAELNPELGVQVWKLAANLVILVVLIWWVWITWGRGRL